MGGIDHEMPERREHTLTIAAYLSSLDVGGEIDLIGQLRDVHLEPLLHLVQGLRVGLVADKGDSQTLGTKPTISKSEKATKDSIVKIAIQTKK